MNLFQFRGQIVDDYERFTGSFSKIAAKDIKDFVNQRYDEIQDEMKSELLHNNSIPLCPGMRCVKRH